MPEIEDAAAANLAKIDHVVVLMLENRSFDHMLGYLSLSGKRPEIDGLRPGMSNMHAGRSYPIHRLDTTAVELDPDHSASGIDSQVGGGAMDGFVASAAATLGARGVGDGDPACVMGYYDAADVPVFDHLAEQFAVCDRWFSSTPGSTMPNRLYALCGGAAGSRDNRPAYLPPLYHQSSFVRHLDVYGVPWRWYSFDPASLRLADLHYRLGHQDRFGYFSKTGLPWLTILDITVNQDIPSFLEDAATGALPSVSWIDPAFTNFNPLGFPVNDDHPPADIRDGQELVLAVYDALASSPQWARSLLIVVYDEHGGFFDHVPPPQGEDDDSGMFSSYGVRVPALVVSPFIEPRTVSSTLFDHTSIIKSILMRFCPEALHEQRSGQLAAHAVGGRAKPPGRRVVEANHLGPVLSRDVPRPAPSRDSLVRQSSGRTDRTGPTQLEPRPPGTDRRLDDLQRSFLVATEELRRRGHPPNTP